MRTRSWRAGSAVIAGAAVVLAAALGLHALVPGWLGTALDSGLPWLGLLLVPLLALSALRRSRRAFAVALVPVVVWTTMFGRVLLPRSGADHHDLRIATLNLGAANADAAATVRAVAGEEPDVLVLQELTTANRKVAERELRDGWEHRIVAGTVGLWSRLPLTGTAAVDIGIGWTRALRASVTTPDGPVRVYAAHLASARPGATAERDQTLAALAREVAADRSERLVVAGDLNTTTTDRRFRELAPLRDTQQEAGAGFGFTWPAELPVMRPDHILQRGMSTQRSWVVRVPGSDHRAALAEIDTA
ncbi:endonuclease/exonuclease/phosphatase family protein [Pseudosporangium ferrugineum]|uniref:Vancomycin resistance protein VanJ n=1 Tax=Pseudosporangium ferrugineum TaxID=439699 RepID=A0A2T0SI27_9ACTN|nr:endonuclease/exonuclease/phosphatase family protein [Pseudosporangium ferrugineum]PRY33013.1 vancomycin resistance protein VanJ [Pseudosporangium ferrugineum]